MYVSAQLPGVAAGLAGQVYRKTEGNALFMADLVRTSRNGGGQRSGSRDRRNVPSPCAA